MQSMVKLGLLFLLWNAQVMAQSPEAQVWFTAGQAAALQSAQVEQMGARAKNVILFLGDGMGLSTITSARIMAGQLQGLSGEEYQLSFEKFPFTALSKTYNVNQQIPDSAGTMSAIMTGVKTNAGVLSVDEQVRLGEYEKVAAHRLRTLLEEAEMAGLSTGVVTTTRLTHATPAACYAHNAHRDWEDNSAQPSEAEGVGHFDIARQLIEFSYGDGIEVALGGGRRHFMLSSQQDPEYPSKTGKRTDGRDLITAWQAKYPEGQYIWNKKDFDSLNAQTTTRLLGLFEHSNMQYEIDRPSDTAGEPSLSDMTAKAIEVLAHNPKGFFLMVEGGRIDHAHHEGKAHVALRETIEFAKAVQAGLDKTSRQDTLIIVTADHSHPLTFSGYPVRGNPILGKVMEWGKLLHEAVLGRDSNGLPYTTLGYANGPGARPARPDLSHIDTEHHSFLPEALIPLSEETHSGEDVIIYAIGPGAHWVHGVQEQNVIYHWMRRALFVTN